MNTIERLRIQQILDLNRTVTSFEVYVERGKEEEGYAKIFQALRRVIKITDVIPQPGMVHMMIEVEVSEELAKELEDAA